MHPHVAEIAARALDFPGLTVSEVMVPRQEVAMLPRHATMNEVQRIVIQHPHTRFPIFDTSPDDIVGYMNIKDLATRGWQSTVITLDDVLRPVQFVPASKPAADLLKEMQKQRIPIAIVVEAHGGVAGVITIEDLLEELVGALCRSRACSMSTASRPTSTYRKPSTTLRCGQPPQLFPAIVCGTRTSAHGASEECTDENPEVREKDQESDSRTRCDAPERREQPHRNPDHNRRQHRNQQRPARASHFVSADEPTGKAVEERHEEQHERDAYHPE